MLLGTSSPGVKYAGVFLGAMGIYPCIANTIAWVSNNVEGNSFFLFIDVPMIQDLQYIYFYTITDFVKIRHLQTWCHHRNHDRMGKSKRYHVL